MRAIIPGQNDKQQVIDLKGNYAAHTAGTRMNARGGYCRIVRGNQRNPEHNCLPRPQTLSNLAYGFAKGDCRLPAARPAEHEGMAVVLQQERTCVWRARHGDFAAAGAAGASSALPAGARSGGFGKC